MCAKVPVCAVVTRRFRASAESVFDAWIQRARLAEWMFGPTVPDEEIVHLAIDPRVGGSFSVLVQRGEEQVEHTGKYLEIERPRRLVFTWMIADQPMGSRVLVDVESDGDACEVRVTHELHPDWAGDVAAMERAWGHMLGVLENALSAGG